MRKTVSSERKYVGYLYKFKADSLVDEKPPIQEGLRIEGSGALIGRVQHGAMLQF